MAASKQIPFMLRFLLTTVEPLFTMGGVYLILTSPESYVSNLSRGTLSSSLALDFMSSSQAGSWLFFAFMEAIVFRAIDDLRTWRWICTGMLLSDILHCHHIAQGVGGWNIWLDVATWTAEDWVVTVTTIPFLSIRLAIVAGLWSSRDRVKSD